MRGPFGEKLIFKKYFSLDDVKSKSFVFFIDEKLKDRIDKSALLKHPTKVLKGGEKLKTFDQYQENLEFLFENKAHKKTTIVAIGGGSLLDSVGFLSSTFLRGVDLILVPTTWLSCIDASIGGKTALNWLDKKNQIGTVYPPKGILFFENLIHESSIKEAQGEILKTIFLNHGAGWINDYILKDKIKDKMDFKILKNFVRYKTKIVKSDPLEKKGLRTVLNFGHTVGHIVELKKNLSHGESVLYGLRFSLDWSFHKGKINQKNYKKLIKLLPQKAIKSLNLNERDINEYLSFDKKREGDMINFVFINDKGPEVLKIKLKSLIKEFKRQTDD